MERRRMSQDVVAEIRAEIARQGITPASVAQATDMPRSSLHRKLTSKTEFTLGEAEIVCSALGVALSEMVRRAEAAREVAA